MLPNILPIEDTEVSQALEKSFAKQGVQLLTNHKTTKTEAIGEGVRIAVADPKGAEKTLEAEMALVAIGVSPVLPGGSLKIGLDEKGFIKVNDRYETWLAFLPPVILSDPRGSRTLRVSRRLRPSKDCLFPATSRER
jgi:dihydrolipoamide dehydrogenase